MPADESRSAKEYVSYTYLALLDPFLFADRFPTIDAHFLSL